MEFRIHFKLQICPFCLNNAHPRPTEQSPNHTKSYQVLVPIHVPRHPFYLCSAGSLPPPSSLSSPSPVPPLPPLPPPCCCCCCQRANSASWSLQRSLVTGVNHNAPQPTTRKVFVSFVLVARSNSSVACFASFGLSPSLLPVFFNPIWQ